MKSFVFARLIPVAALVAIVPLASMAQSPETKPPPGEEVMRPTQRGLRLTPNMAKCLAGMFVTDGPWKGMELTEDQEQRLAEAVARRMMQTAHRGGRDGQAAFEYLIETMTANLGSSQFKIRDYVEFADKMQPIVRGGREFLDGLVEDSRLILSEDQLKKLESEFEEARRGLDRFERRLQDCREGRVKEGENPLEDLDREEPKATEPEKPKVDERVRNAQRSAEWEMQRVTTWDWRNFLAGAVTVFKFDDAQKAKGEALLEEYRKKADAVQTPEWKARIQRNRVQVNLQRELADVARGPWLYRLEKEYREALRPLQDLTGEFQKAVLALATEQQRAEALDQTRSVLEKFGLAVGESEMTLLRGLLQ